MQGWSTSEFIFNTMRASSPARAASAVAAISSSSGSRMFPGATSTLRWWRGRAKPVSELKMSATSAVIAGSVVKRPKSS